MPDSEAFKSLESLEFIVDRANVGLVVLDREFRICLWNRFMAIHSGKPTEDVLGQNVFGLFPELPQRWLEKKIHSVFMLKSFAFTSWEQRPYLFRFPHNRPITGGVEFMQQDCTFMPMKNTDGDVEYVCLCLQDVTDTSLYQSMLKEAMAKLEATSRIDGLTQIFNRRHWESRLSEEFTRVQRYGGNLSVILFDLDHFKHINDTYGHLCGDQVLRQVSGCLHQLLREADVAGRYGGEEFGIILPNTEIKGAMAVAERVRAHIEHMTIPFQEHQLKVTTSLGVAWMRPEMSAYEKLLSAADKALYRSKSQGRNQVNAAD